MSKSKELLNKTLAGLMVASMTAGLCPTTVFAVTGGAVAKDGTYTKTAHVTDEDEEGWLEYDVTVSLKVADGKFADVTITPSDDFDEDENGTYYNYAINGRTRRGVYYPSLKEKIVGQAATADTVNGWDAVSGATMVSNAMKEAALEAINEADEAVSEPDIDTTALEAAISSIETEQLVETEYTEESWNALQTALADAKTALESKESQTAVDAAAAALADARAGLEKKPVVEVQTAELEKAITDAEALKAGDYTEESWNALQTALTEAKAALEAKESQTAVDAAAEALNTAVTKLEKAEQNETIEYVLMNIPYDKFYEADVENSVPVDAFTSATKSKVRTGTLAGGSYHVDNTGDEITGVTFPVKVPEGADLSEYTQVTDETSVDITVTNRGQTNTTTYKGKDALFENASYSYYVLNETPSFYKEMTVNADGSLSFGKTVGTAETINASAELLTKTSYGDYQLNLDFDADGLGIDKVYGVIISTKEGNDYGLRHLENIWRVTELAWASGFTDNVHNCPTSSAHYEKMMGQTIDKVTYYTDNGIYEIPMEVYVPKKFATELSVADASVEAGKTTVTVIDLPSDFDAAYSVEGLEITVKDGELSFSNAMPGKYTLTVSDRNDGYAPISTDFVLSTTAMPAAYNENDAAPAIVAAKDISEAEFANYIANITSVSVNGKAYAASGRGSVTIINQKAEDGILGALKTDADAFKEGQSFEINVTATGYDTPLTFTWAKEEASEYQYVYAGLTWAEYWAAEDVQSAGSAEASDEEDTKGELDKGAFDTVSRATTNYGLHRGSYQCSAVIYMKDGTEYEVAYYTGATAAVLTDGTEITYDKNDIAYYHVTGLKYVPVKVATADYEDFCKAYTVVENGGKLSGGFSENQLEAYTNVTAEVTENTNGLKTATKNADGSFSFSARAVGGDSGIQGSALKVASGIEPTVKDANGSYGEFLRVDLNGSYGDLAANMQAVKWTYYGDDSTYSNALATYGTKFAADNWMHKSMGIQLGLTDSLRCTLPDGTDGTGYWTLTVYALGYEDYIYKFEATDANIVKADPVTDTSKLEAAIAAAEALRESDYTADSWASMQTELAEAKEELVAKHSQSAADEATAHLNAAIEALVKAVEEPVYVLMNIPYAEFYAADVNNDVPVDVFSSATKNKVRTDSLAGGSYHVDNTGDEITGITFPVKVTDGVDLSKYTKVTDETSVDITVTNRGQTSTKTYTGKDALFENATYAYYVLNEAPAFYKEATVNADGTLSFGKTVGDVQSLKLENTDIELMTDTSYGDYQLNLDFDADGLGIDKVYGVIISTREGNDYGLRHLENIWRVTELAWASGFTDAVHNCPTSSAHYEKMMGQTIDKVTYYTDNGIYEIPMEVYVPVKFEGSLEVADAAVTAGSTAVFVTGLPSDFEAKYSVEGLENIRVADGRLSFGSSAEKGKYTLTIEDESGKYAPISADFILYTEEMPAAYNDDDSAPALIPADDAEEAEFADYIANITSVSVNGKAYASSGRGAVAIINQKAEDGILGALKTDAAPFAEGEVFEIIVTATGYQPLSFTYTKEAAPDDEIDTKALAALIAKAEALKENDYTDESWKALESALQSAKTALDVKESQSAVDGAADKLQSAIDSLEKVVVPPVIIIDTEALEKTINDAKALNKAEYTEKSWAVLEKALAAAEAALDEEESQEAVDAAAADLQAAIDALKKAENDGSDSQKDDRKDNSSNSNKTNTNKKTTASGSSPKTGDAVNVWGLLAAGLSSVGLGGFGWKLRRKSKKNDEEV